MQTTNDRMTEEQVTDLLNLAAELQAKAEASNDRDTAVMAYAVQKVCLELTESRLKSKASEQQLAAVVAENERAVKAVSVFSNVTHDITEIICDELGQERVAEIVAAYNDLGNMPATDAFLAEVRAQGVELYADNLDSSADDAERDGFDDAVKFLRSEASGVRLFAAQLRQGAAL